MFKAVIFDIDGTLSPGNSWQAFTRDIGASVEDHLAIYLNHVNGKIGLDESKEQLLKMWQATGMATESHIQTIFDRWPIRKEAFELVGWLKEHNYSICLITGSVGIYAQHVADKLGVADWYANAELYFDQAGNLSSFHYTADQAEVKLKQFQEYCHKYNLLAAECVPVGDSDNDIDLFLATGNGILLEDGKVNPELKQSAWKVVSSLAEVRRLLEA